MSFNHAALTYDADFTQTPLARWLRGRVWERFDSIFEKGLHVLEIGCGTGEDAVYLARQGVQVTATDASPEMLKITQHKAQNLGLSLTTHLFDLNQPDTWHLLDGQFDGVYSNFGALNCTPNWSRLAQWLMPHLKPSAKIGIGIMGRFCLWETLWHGLHGDWRTANRRWRGENEAILADGSCLKVYYPSQRELRRAFKDFTLTYQMGVGVFLPSSDIYPLIEARPWLQNGLTFAEKQITPHLTWLADHQWWEFSTP